MKNTTILKTSNYGNNLKRLGTLFWVYCLLFLTVGYSQTGTIGIGGTGTSTSGLMPINSCYNFNYTQQIVTASEFGANGGIAGNITKVRFYYTGGDLNQSVWNNWTVYLGHTAKTAFTSNSDWEPVANLTQVYSGSITPVANNWFEITFTTPFNYNGTSNMIIAVDENVANYSCTANFGSYVSTSNSGIYYFSDSTNPNPASPPAGTRTSSIARLQFVGQLASCLAPGGLTSSGVSVNAATVNWNAAATATAGYDYYYSTSNTAPTASTVPSGSVAAGLTTAPLSGLTSNTVYYAWVRSNCGGGSTSSWSASVSFATPCDATDIPYTENFESATTPAIPSCTSVQNAGTGNNWATINNPGFGFPNKALRYLYNSANAANAWFYTRGLSLTAGVSYRVSYKYGNDYTFYTEKLKVSYGTNPSAAAMTTVLANHPAINTGTPTTTFVDFVPATTGVYYIGFNAYSAANQNQLFLDNISVTVTPSCEPVTGVAASTVSFTSGNVVWNASASVPANGYEYYYSAANTAPVAATAPSGSVASGILQAPLTGLTTNTNYYVWVRAVCSSEDSSPWAGPSSFYTGYCTPAPTSVDAQGIVNVSMGSISNPSGVEPGNYGDYSALSTDAAVGATVNFAITYQTGYTYGTKIWIDWNNDADFNDLGELVYTGLSTNANPTTLSGSFAIPADAALVGMHRVRIGGTDTDAGGDPCYSGAYGSYEDYSINIFMPPSPVITAFTPASYCAIEGVITITGTSLGNAVLEIGGTAVATETNSDTEITATVPAGVSGTVSVTTVSGNDTTVEVFTVNAPTEIVLSAAEAMICLGESTDLVTITAGASAFDTFVWSPSEGVTGNEDDGYVFTPSETTTYTLTASQSAGACIIAVDYVVTVNPVPAAVTVSPDTTDACFGTPVALTAAGGEMGSAVAYCIPSVTSNGASGDFINNFSFANLTNNGSGDTAADYTFYSALTANVTGGQSYAISMQSGLSWSQQFRVWIDYNQDGVFSADESVYNTTVAATTVFTGSVTIPVTAFNGVTRMRVACRFSGAVGAGDSCSHTGFGEYEDYNVNITGAASPVDYVWSPVEGLYTDAAGTIAYTGEPAITVYAMPDASATYTATVSSDMDCTASGSTTLTLYNTPAPTGSAQQDFTAIATVADLTATGDEIQWYTSATGGEALTDGTELTSGSYYATQTQNGCESFTRFEVMVTVPEMDWVNLQWPPVLSVVEGSTGTVYAQGWEPGVTPGAGPGIGVTAWIGVSTDDTNPSTWTTWIPMTFNTQVGNNDEFMAEIGAGLAPGTYYYASRFKLMDGPYSYGGYNPTGGSFWNGTEFVSGVLTVTCGTPAPMADAVQEFCNAATVAGLMAEGTAVVWYASETGGTPLTSSTALVNGATYYASQNTGCESVGRTAVTVMIYTTPAPAGAGEQSLGYNGTVGDLNVTGTDVQWYTSATGDVLVDISAPLTEGISYYASQTLNGCESQVRLEVTIMVMPPTMDYVNLQFPADLTITQGSTGNVYAQGYEEGVTQGTGPGVGVMAWIGVSTENTDPSTWTTWIPATFNMQVGNNDEFVAAVGNGLDVGTYYYASRFQYVDGPYSYGGYSAAGGNFWNGTTAVNGVLTVVCAASAPSAAAMQSFCHTGTVAELSADGEAVLWYDQAEGGMPLDGDMALTNGGVYYATQTMGGCESVSRSMVTVMVNQVAAPAGEATQVITVNVTETATLENIAADYTGTITWYASEEDAMSGTGALSQDTPLVTGTTYYATQTVGDCTSMNVLAVTVEVVLGNEHFDTASFSYYPNPVRDVLTITYSSDITAVVVYNLLGQEVISVQPNTADAKIDMSLLSDGAYIVTVASGTATKTIRVIKK